MWFSGFKRGPIAGEEAGRRLLAGLFLQGRGSGARGRETVQPSPTQDPPSHPEGGAPELSPPLCVRAIRRGGRVQAVQFRTDILTGDE